MLTKALSLSLGLTQTSLWVRFDDDRRYVACYTTEQFAQEAKDKLKASRKVVIDAIAKATDLKELKAVYNKYPSFKVSLKEAYAKRTKQLKEVADKKVFAEVKEHIAPESEGGKKYKASATLEEVETMIAEAKDIKD